MGMLKGDSNSLNFDQLMAQATQVAKQQDASLMEKARQKRREDEERRRRQEKEQREREEAQALINRKRELQEKKQKLLMDQKKLDKRRMDGKLSTSSTTKSRTSSSSGVRSTSSSSKKTNVASFFPEKKKPVHMSFEELMKKAKEQSITKGGKPEPKAPLPPKKYASHDSKPSNDNTPTLYHRLKKPEATKSSPSALGGGSAMSARDRARLLVQEPPKKVNVQKRDRRSISDVQREIRRSKGIYSDDEDDRGRQDPRLMQSKNRSQSTTTGRFGGRNISPPSDPRRKRPVSPPQRPVKKFPPPLERRPNSGPPASAPLRRMPFSGRPLDPSARKPVQRRRPREEEEEEDEELASFIVDDDDEDDDPRYSRGPRKNSYSDEISKIFRYDKNRYANESVYSDDDMEADASDVLREEKRSERLARREDYLEEQKELERLKKRKKNMA